MHLIISLLYTSCSHSQNQMSFSEKKLPVHHQLTIEHFSGIYILHGQYCGFCKKI